MAPKNSGSWNPHRKFHQREPSQLHIEWIFQEIPSSIDQELWMINEAQLGNYQKCKSIFVPVGKNLKCTILFVPFDNCRKYILKKWAMKFYACMKPMKMADFTFALSLASDWPCRTCPEEFLHLQEPPTYTSTLPTTQATGYHLPPPLITTNQYWPIATTSNQEQLQSETKVGVLPRISIPVWPKVKMSEIAKSYVGGTKDAV